MQTLINVLDLFSLGLTIRQRLRQTRQRTRQAYIHRREHNFNNQSIQIMHALNSTVIWHRSILLIEFCVDSMPTLELGMLPTEIKLHFYAAVYTLLNLGGKH